MVVIILLLLVPALFITSVGSLFGGCSFDDQINYEESTFQTYANARYEEAFADTEDYENNILIVFTTYEGYDGWECIPWGGNHIDKEVDYLFGEDFEYVVYNNIPEYYENSLTKNWKYIIEKMTEKVEKVVDAPEGDVDTSFSKLYNRSNLNIDSETVNAALVEFTEKTGISIALVIDEGADVFGVESGNDDKVIMIFAIVLIVIVAIVIIMNNKSKKNKASTEKTDPDAGQGTYDPNSGTWKQELFEREKTMSKKRPRHLQANSADEVKFQIEEDRRIYEKNRDKPKVYSNPWQRRGGSIRSRWNPAYKRGIASLDDGCLWSLAKYILVPIVLVIFVFILKACS